MFLSYEKKNIKTRFDAIFKQLSRIFITESAYFHVDFNSIQRIIFFQSPLSQSPRGNRKYPRFYSRSIVLIKIPMESRAAIQEKRARERD